MSVRIIFPFALALATFSCGSDQDSTFDDGGAESRADASPGAGMGADIAFGEADGGGTKPGGSTTGDAGKSDVLTLTLRDFKLYAPGDPTTNPDFENVPKTDAQGYPNAGYQGPWDDLDIVTANLGADGKPVYKNAAGKTLTTHGKTYFDQWFRDVPGTNYTVTYPVKLTKNATGAYEFDSEKTGVPLSAQDPTRMFFPLDDGTPYATPFGQQGDPHNYCFTVELHTRFTYRGGEFFNFRGDDDVFVYIDGKLVINLGGIHGPSKARVEADSLGLAKGTEHTLDFFSAERHKTGSNILFTTTLDLKDSDIR